jgi:hypothetical protein
VAALGRPGQQRRPAASRRPGRGLPVAAGLAQRWAQQGRHPGAAAGAPAASAAGRREAAAPATAAAAAEAPHVGGRGAAGRWRYRQQPCGPSSRAAAAFPPPMTTLRSAPPRAGSGPAAGARQQAQLLHALHPQGRADAPAAAQLAAAQVGHHARAAQQGAAGAGWSGAAAAQHQGGTRGRGQVEVVGG